MGIDWGKIRVVSEQDNFPRNLSRMDVFNHIASLGVKTGYAGKLTSDVEEVYEHMKRSPSMRGNAVAKTYGQFGAYVEKQLLNNWKLLMELPEK